MKLNWKAENKMDQAGIKAIRILQSKGFKAFWVGGIVRNILLKRESDNIDIATDALPNQVKQILEPNGFFTKFTGQGERFGTLYAIAQNVKKPIEITTFRSEGRYSDNRHPDNVQFIREYLDDARRRDFTVNALYFDPIKKELFDPTSGLKDLKGKLLRFVGDPKKRIDEDALRMLRGVRLATQLGFKLEKNSFAAIKTRAKYIQGISGERIKAELDKILLSKNRVEGIGLLDKIGLLRFIIPEMEAMKKFTHKSKFYHLEANMFEHTLLALSHSKSQDLNLIYALLFHDLGKPLVGKNVRKDEGWVISTKGHAEVSADIFLKFAKEIKFPKKNQDTVEWLIRNHMLQSNFWEMRFEKQMRIASHPAFGLLLDHWICDSKGTKRKKGYTEHDVKFEKSLKAARQIVQRLKVSEPLLKKLAKGELIMKYSKFKPGIQLGQKIEGVKVQIVLGNIKNEHQLRKFLESSL